MKIDSYLNSISEDSVSQQERVEEVNRQESQIRQSLKQSLRSGVTNLRHFTIIEAAAESDIHVILKIGLW